MDSTTLYPLDYPALARRAIDGGFTIGLDGQTPTSGYAVSDRPDAERAITLHTRLDRDFAERWNLAHVADALYTFVIDRGRELRTSHKLGAWRDGDRVVIDLVRVLDDYAQAIETARDASQEAIYDLANGVTITLADDAVAVDAIERMRQHES